MIPRIKTVLRRRRQHAEQHSVEEPYLCRYYSEIDMEHASETNKTLVAREPSEKGFFLLLQVINAKEKNSAGVTLWFTFLPQVEK